VSDEPTTSRRRRRLSRTAAVLAVAATGLLLAACGGPAAPGVASLGTTTTAAPTTGGANPGLSSAKYADGLKFSECMRAHGVPNFPDPGSSGAIAINGNLGVSRSVMQAAQNKCRHLLPNGGRPSAAQLAKMEAQALKFSQCMRAHGLPNFPDPNFSTQGGGLGITIHSQSGSGIDKNSPIFQNAQKACQGIIGGPKLGVTRGGPATQGGGAQVSGA
jgi:hypothetical protein